MDECYTLTEENPRKNASPFSRLCYGWMWKICYKGNREQLELKDLYKCREEDKSSTLADRLEKAWQEELKKQKNNNDIRPSLLMILMKSFYWKFLYQGIFLIFNLLVLRITQPILLAALLRCFDSDRHSYRDILIYGGGLVFLIILSTFINYHVYCDIGLTGMKIRIATSSLIYRKILRLNQLSLSATTPGQMINLLANDVSRFDSVIVCIHMLFIGPIQVIVITYFLWVRIGNNVFVCITGMLVLNLPLQMILGALTSKYRAEMAKKTDERVRIMNEIFTGIKVIKMYVWEKPLEKLIKVIRKEEMMSLTKSSYVKATLVSLMVLTEKASLALTIIFYVLMGHVIHADIVFELSMFLNILQFTLGIVFSSAISIGAETIVSIKRLQDFLLLEEKEDSDFQNSSDYCINLNHIYAHWSPEKITLQDLTLKITPGSLYAVVGPVGSGKSSLLKLLLGELKTSSGILQMSGEVSYASQEPWLFTSTIRRNITFGQEYNINKYRVVVKVCSLEMDFEQFKSGDKTSVGDRGVSLSGGQKARINLARAMYRDADVYLLDDPLSAVDTKVGRHLFDQCILGYLKNKTRILITHQLQYLNKADKIIVFNKGRIEAQGTFRQLVESGLDFTSMLAEEINETKNENDELLSPVSPIATTIPVKHVKKTNENIEEIVHFQGSALLYYIGNCRNIPMKIVVFLLMILSQLLLSGSDYWITLWTNQENLKEVQEKIFFDVSNISTSHNINYLKYESTDRIFSRDETFSSTQASIRIYIFLIVAAVIVTLTRSFLFFYACMGGSKKLHDKMFQGLMNAPLKFFDINPTGRVLNRFSKDMGAIDDQLPRTLMIVFQIVLAMFGIIILICISNPYLLVIMVVLGTMFFQVRKWYIKAARVLKHMESITKSPVFSYISSSVDGLTTIRSTKSEKILMRQFDEHQDVHTSAWYLTILCYVSFGLWLDLICVIFLCSVIGGFTILNRYTSISGSFVGLGITQSLSLIGMLTFGMKQTAEVINLLISVERISEYTKLEKEVPLGDQIKEKPESSWPNEGQIEFRKLYLKYALTDPPILTNLNIEIRPAEKIGVVGRTGAGKSSLIAALFRLAITEGEIIIDNKNIEAISLRDLRKRISIIPQDPVLFSAPLRYNLDPFNEFKDDLLWEVLEQVELKNDIQSLNFKITESGSNFSVGQRQLICLARAILRNNKILVLDEATANVDPKTDELIQKTIRKKFINCTVLTIAHRLNTIMDSDKVLVMDNGRIVEFDHPHVLLKKEDGLFTKMLLETGSLSAINLKEIAEKSYESIMY